MKKIFKICCIAFVIIGTFSLFMPYSKSETYGIYKFNVTYVNGVTKNIFYKLPNKFTYSIESNRGSYSLNIISDAKTIWGYTTPIGFCEYTVPGILTVNSIKQLK